MQKESSTKNNIMSIRMPEEDRARIETIRRYFYESSGVMYTASDIIRLLIRAVAGRIEVEKEEGGEDNG